MLGLASRIGWVFFSIATIALADTDRAAPPNALRLQNGWFVYKDRVIWGYAQRNAWWRPGERPNITRRDPGVIAPNRTEDLDKLTDNMIRFAYPGFEHNFGLWYDRRRDQHDTAPRKDDKVVPPFLEQPWARSESGRAWDGLPKYDLTQYNAWYFDRLKMFASLCDRKGAVFFHNFYLQHALLEADTHYCDFPWRPANCIQTTEMPDRVPAANAFYDVSHPLRRELHRAYIRKCLDELSPYSSVVHMLSEEYTGPASFAQFWLDVVSEWEKEKSRKVLIGIGATKDVLDVIAGDPRVSVVDLRYWWYKPDGSVFAPKGGIEVAGRYTSGRDASKTTPLAIYRQTQECRLRYPDKALIHRIEASRQQSLAFLFGGGSMLVRNMVYADAKDPIQYEVPPDSAIIQPTYDFLNRNLTRQLQAMTPQQSLINNPDSNFCLADAGRTYLVYAMAGGPIQLDLKTTAGEFRARWFDPRTGALRDAREVLVEAGAVQIFDCPSTEDWVLWLAADSITEAK